MKNPINPAVIALFSLLWSTAVWSNPMTWQELRPLVAGAAPLGTAQNDTFRGTGPVIAAFFASWCPPCTNEFKHLNELAGGDEFGDAQIIGINLFEDFGNRKNPARMARFLDRTRPVFPLVQGTDEIGIAFGDIQRIPTVVVFGENGQEVWRFVHQQGSDKTHATTGELVEALKLARDTSS